MTCRHIQYADLHGCNVLCCRYFLRRVSVRFRVTVYTQLAIGVYWDCTPLTASTEIFKVYISFTLFTCDCTLIYTLMYCVCQHTDPGMAQKHRGLTRLESSRYTKELGQGRPREPTILGGAGPPGRAMRACGVPGGPLP